MSPANDDAQRSRDEIAGEWCVRLASRPLPPDERVAFEAWLGADPANSHAYDKALSVWHGLQAIGGAPEIIGHRADALDALRQANRRRWGQPAGRRWVWPGAIAASLLVAVAIGLMLFQSGAQALETGLGERRTAMLEDGSRLSLDAETRVAVDYRAGRRALQLLAGRAKFDVAHDAARPFTVVAADRTIVATGTSFSVEVLAASLRVIVYEGHVAVLPGAADDRRVLEVVRGRRGAGATPLVPGRELLVDLERPAGQTIRDDVGRSLSWEGGQLDFLDEPLSSAAERLNRYTSRRIRIADAAAASIQVNGVFNAGDEEAFLEAVAQAYPVRVESAGGEWIIHSAR